MSPSVREAEASSWSNLDLADVLSALCQQCADLVSALEGFYPAEAYHQDYLTRNPTNPYIVYNDLPKVAALKHLYPEVYRTDPVLVAAVASAQ